MFKEFGGWKAAKSEKYCAVGTFLFMSVIMVIFSLLEKHSTGRFHACGELKIFKTNC